MLVWHPYMKCTMTNKMWIPAAAAESGAPTTLTTAMTVYGGTQPTAADFLANWDATYKNNHLLHWQGFVITHANNTNPTTGILVTATTIPAATVAANSGTATWGIVWHTNVAAGTLASATIPNAAFMVVPVTGTGGNGILKLGTTGITSGSSYAAASYGIQMTGIN